VCGANLSDKLFAKGRGSGGAALVSTVQESENSHFKWKSATFFAQGILNH
jgi:hypothetical protein